VEDTTAYFLPSEPFLDVLESSTAVCLRVLVLLTNRLRASNGRLGELRATQVIAGSQYQGQVEV
jgi:CRP-like cAMP-binding protein